MPTATAIAPSAPPTAPGRLVAVDGRELPLRATHLRADACGGLARVVVEQTFTNPYEEPLQVSYALPLPHDAAVAGFAFRIGERRVVGEIDRVENARERFLDALMEGRTAALLEQDRGSLFHQEVGNVPPGETVIAEVTVDQLLDWDPTGAWVWRFPTVVAPRYLGAPGRTPDAGRMQQDVAAPGGPVPALTLDLHVRDRMRPWRRPASPTHPVRSTAARDGHRVRLEARDAALPDRDLVVRWTVAGAGTNTSVDVAAPSDPGLHPERAYGLLTIVPPASRSPGRTVPRDLIVLIDTSGSMTGEPLDLAKAVAERLVGSLGPDDTLELIAFGSRPERWHQGPRPATGPERADALAWIRGLEADGGTEMVDGMLAALSPLRRDAQRQVVLITDGLVGFEQEVVAAVREQLPEGTRLHAVGVGPASNRSLTGPCARAGRGIEVIVDQEDELEAITERLLARLRDPVVTGLTVSGTALAEVADDTLPDLYLGQPARIPVALHPTGGTLELRGRTADGPWESRVSMPAVTGTRENPALTTLFGRVQVETLELDRAAGAGPEWIDEAIEGIGLRFGIATRRTAWVAVSEEVDVDPGKPTRRVRQPQQLPRGLSAEGLGLEEFAADESLSVHYCIAPDAAMAEMKSEVFDEVASYLVDAEPVPGPDRASRRASSELPPLRPGRHHGQAFQARILRKTDDLLLLEIELLRGDFTWIRRYSMKVIWSDGDSSRLDLIEDQCTRDGPIAPGASFRVALRQTEASRHRTPAALSLIAGGPVLVPIDDHA